VVFLLELLALDNRQVGLLQVVYALVENLGHIGAAELSIETVLIYLIVAHCLVLFLLLCFVVSLFEKI
jgi:hypothetical protein